MKLKILSPGPLTTVQDEGRFGFQNTGFSPGGAMDLEAAKCANYLVGNLPGEAVLEMTLMGITAQFDCDAVIALTGANMSATVNGNKIPMYESVCVKCGDTLSLPGAIDGMRTYLAVAGGFDLPLVMRSRSTNLKCGIGGFHGRKLEKGDEIFLRCEISSFKKRSAAKPNFSCDHLSLHVMLGPQDDYFTPEGIRAFFQNEYTVSSQSDRMGIRLQGAAVQSRSGVDIISDGTVTGSVQIPNSGEPIIMMADRQTTGGYAKIATVISSDLMCLAQARPGTKIRFYAVSEKMAVLEKKTQALKYKRWESAFPPLFGKETQ